MTYKQKTSCKKQNENQTAITTTKNNVENHETIRITIKLYEKMAIEDSKFKQKKTAQISRQGFPNVFHILSCLHTKLH